MIVVDASVALKWFVPELQSSEALDLVSRPLIAPDLIEAELAHALTKKVRRREVEDAQARASFAEISVLMTLAPSRPVAAAALEIALELQHAAYDCYYLALAEAQSVALVTADRKFVAKVRQSRWAPLVVTLGEALPVE